MGQNIFDSSMLDSRDTPNLRCTLAYTKEDYLYNLGCKNKPPVDLFQGIEHLVHMAMADMG